MDIRFSYPMGTDVIAVGAAGELILDRPSTKSFLASRSRWWAAAAAVYRSYRQRCTYRIITKNNGAMHGYTVLNYAACQTPMFLSLPLIFSRRYYDVDGVRWAFDIVR
ncbi:hypothetical protein H112_00756 [Trichophyton rubrum D6]|uniref:Uncharacterized protein n=3 Tax=Trichophyton TaxID=5550 RepID=F2SZA0_TRIRC|nr:uncharacterized protein TERG_07871 [Trichophyton rubrum CBS 118892]XP_047607394.1 uncharacterized protein TERG_07871 [Trichophyton rubrum CBS 118892]EZF27255.1 hypothetical protein H100_00755 [Trichophyton rubrum MR850]EZF46261.1 hypothetical protein H102_00745 [Trichophyton rubrum CBS 100081]EZF56920.1 hypothetical protein H103_00752 [Trichophyton rubrum CBS 288.86]EZF67464.1 hypothetical protein H104_00739 [Trichophyton rubrum CBS 289.86]EZF78127.1 hypothetical protein H105_00749 [Tricho